MLVGHAAEEEEAEEEGADEEGRAGDCSRACGGGRGRSGNKSAAEGRAGGGGAIVAAGAGAGAAAERMSGAAVAASRAASSIAESSTGCGRDAGTKPVSMAARPASSRSATLRLQMIQQREQSSCIIE